MLEKLQALFTEWKGGGDDKFEILNVVPKNTVPQQRSIIVPEG